jgi:phosphohistidine swiveling domain-containing protein
MINKIDDSDLEKILNFDFKNVEKLLTNKEFFQLNKILKKEKINIDGKNLLIFCIASLKLRENYKFIFSRSLSDGIQLLRNYSVKMGITEHFSNVDLNTIFKIQKKSDLRTLKHKFYTYKNQSEYFNYVKLPYLIVSNNDFFVSSILLSKPNFITDRNISGKLIFLDGKSKKKSLKNMIVVIENADPGFDWIFSHKIKGLITKFGGINSHMSIRCEELNVPAIIGFGEDNYSKIINKKELNINCKLQKISFGE